MKPNSSWLLFIFFSPQELKHQSDSHRQEIKTLQDRLQLEIEEHVKKMKKVHTQYINAPQPKVATNKQVKNLLKLRGMLLR